ncbi:class I SAM-dependent methyltransferase [Methanococcoides orientis]|uniref:class I SAM-dependent methyltransferase n=1 Tax=Methanococcoides orientis TaxID=2822137 RepID=UPI001E5D836F|nr:class I SAM-dependent methyltransferase [Methanococcoides orientis]UGV39737.1 class I SAM-dependent methyltransferase [Methanococcoides orientis]
MTFVKKSVKEEIAGKWDISSQTYDSHHGHAIKSGVEAEAWKKLFKNNFPKGKLEILDVGCGTGELSILLSQMGHHVTGIDLSEKMMEKGKLKARSKGLDITFLKGDAEDPSFEDGSFDVVFNRHLLWTLPNPERALSSWQRILKEGGYAVIVDGVWDDRSLDTRTRRFISNVATMLLERKNPWEHYYSEQIKEHLPNVGGTPSERAHGYLDSAGFGEINCVNLRHIRDIQKKYMPVRQRICYNYDYYLIHGKK